MEAKWFEITDAQVLNACCLRLSVRYWDGTESVITVRPDADESEVTKEAWKQYDQERIRFEEEKFTVERSIEIGKSMLKRDWVGFKVSE